ncbi:hypothetical protein LJC58_10120, partial [Lachnospiraceae bacterium OttesenSCG-928-D06]|nr:hypothetical protein [Lachnospiraceae bacterium OttesenSCG-928-D06]
MNRKFNKENFKIDKEKLLKGLIVAGIIFALIGLVLLSGIRKSANKGMEEVTVNNEENTGNEQVLEDLNAMYDYLSQLDETIYTNSQELIRINSANENISLSIRELNETTISSMNQQLSVISEYLTDISNSITENKTALEQFYQSYESNQQEVENHLSVINGHLVFVSEAIEDSRQEIKNVIVALQEDTQENFEHVNTRINKINKSIHKLNQDLSSM